MFMFLRVTADRSLRLTIRGMPQENLKTSSFFLPFTPSLSSLTMLRRFSFNGGVPLFSNLAGIWYFLPEQTACGGEWTYGVCEFWDVKNSDTWNTSNTRWVLFFFHFWPFSWSLKGDLDLQDFGAHPYFTLLSPWNNSNFVCNAGLAWKPSSRCLAYPCFALL